MSQTSKSVEIVPMPSTKALSAALTSVKEANGKSHFRDKPVTLSKKRPMPEAEDKAAKGLYKLCKEIWMDGELLETYG